MEFLPADAVAEPGERVFRHGRIAPLVMLAIFAVPLGIGTLLAPQLLAAAGRTPWFVWLGLGPVLLIGGLVYGIALQALLGAAHGAFLATNWLLRLSPAGLTLNLRSYQNPHLGEGRTVARLSWSEVALACEVRDVTRRGRDDERAFRVRWLQLELKHADTTALDQAVREERARKAPETRFLGVTSSGRSSHTPVFVPAPGIVRTDWLGGGVLRALREYVPVGERLELDLSRQGDLETRLRDLALRGDEIAAAALAKRELGLSLHAAREHVARLRSPAA